MSSVVPVTAAICTERVCVKGMGGEGGGGRLVDRVSETRSSSAIQKIRGVFKKLHPGS